jgi:hypothetical protein
MRNGRIRRACGATIIGVAALSHPAPGQGRSATLQVTAHVVDVGALGPMSFDPVHVTGSNTAAVPGGSVGVFTLVPPRHSAVALSLQVRGLPADHRERVAIQVCPPSETLGGRCRRVPLVRSADGAQAAAVTGEAVVVRLMGLTEVAADTAHVTVTLAYPGN